MEDNTEDLTTSFACESSVEPIGRPSVKQCVPSTGLKPKNPSPTLPRSRGTCRLIFFLSHPGGSAERLTTVELVTESVIGLTESSSQSSHVAYWAC
ncbi:hypothetical protein Bca4012_078251 [Brassica carinata]